MIVGEIGIPRREFLFRLSFWEARRIVNGYYRRQRSAWSMTRWQTFYLLKAMPFADTEKITKPSDLIPFPWDSEDVDLLEEDEVDDIQGMISQFNNTNHTD